MSRWALSSFQTCLRMCVASRTVGETNQRRFMRSFRFAMVVSSDSPAKTTWAAVLPAYRPVDKPGAADDIFLGEPSPRPRVGAVHGVVAHHHVVMGRNFLFHGLVREQG